MVSSITYGAEITGLPDDKTHYVRDQRLKMAGVYVDGVPLAEQYLAFGPHFDPKFSILWAPLQRYHREVWYVGDAYTRPGDCLTGGELWNAWMQADRLLATKPQQAGPVGLAIQSARKVGWTFNELFLLHGRCGIMSLGAGSPTQFKA